MALEHVERRGQRIKSRREALGLTQEEVAERMQDIHAQRNPDAERDKTRGQMVSDWERAINEPNPRKLELLAAALDWTVGDLNRDAPDRSQTPDLFSIPGGEGSSRALQEEVRALRLELLAAIGEVRTVQEALLQRLPLAVREEEDPGS